LDFLAACFCVVFFFGDCRFVDVFFFVGLAGAASSSSGSSAPSTKDHSGTDPSRRTFGSVIANASSREMTG